MSVTRRRTSRRRMCGVATVEMAVMLPLLLLLVVATAEIGRAFIQYTVLSNAVRNGARFVAGSGTGTTGVFTLSGTQISQTRNVVVYGTTTGGSTPVLPGLAANQISVAKTGTDVTVSAAYPFQSMFGGSLPTFGYGSGSINTVFTMRVVVRMRPLYP